VKASSLSPRITFGPFAVPTVHLEPQSAAAGFRLDPALRWIDRRGDTEHRADASAAPLRTAPDTQHGLAKAADKLIGCVRR